MNTITRTRQQFGEKTGTVRLMSAPKSSRNLRKGIWELARLHTKEAWLCWYPAGQFSSPRYNLRWLMDISMGIVSLSGCAKYPAGRLPDGADSLRYLEQRDSDPLRILHLEVRENFDQHQSLS
jgi:hypothetical protein